MLTTIIVGVAAFAAGVLTGGIIKKLIGKAEK